nr:MAG TPA: hypothetical protein [Caudoviricetes sp.]
MQIRKIECQKNKVLKCNFNSILRPLNFAFLKHFETFLKL